VGTRVTAEQFAGTDFYDTIAGSSGPVVVDFTADWCGPCQQIKPILKDLEAEGKIKLVMIDADQHPQILEQFGVSGIPHLLFVKDGQIGNVLRGSTSRKNLEAIVDTL
jgi:thioredoxin 1